MNVAYVESSAMVKLWRTEPETDALREVLGRSAVLVSSDLTRLEVVRTAARQAGDVGRAQARSVLLGLTTVPVDRQIVDAAAALVPDSLRSLDAIHVATALAVDDGDLVFYSYDRRALEAARANGLRTASPGTVD